MQLMRQHRHGLCLHVKNDLCPGAGPSRVTLAAALPKTHLDFKKGKRRYLGFVNGKVTGRQAPFVHKHIEGPFGIAVTER